MSTVSGTVQLVRGGATLPVTQGMPVQVGDQIHTGDDGQVSILLSDQSTLDLTDSSNVVIDQHAGTTTRVNLVEGKLRSFVNRTVGANTPNFEVHTPNAVAAARGTLFILIFTPPGTTELQVLQGIVNLANLGNLPGGIDVQAGYKATVVGPSDPGKPILLSITGVFPWPLVIGGGLLGATAISIPVAYAVDNSMSSGGPPSPSK